MALNANYFAIIRKYPPLPGRWPMRGSNLNPHRHEVVKVHLINFLDIK